MVVDDGGATWFLAQLKPNCANIAERNLKRQGFLTFLPMEEATWQRSGKFVTGLRPLFPGYIFVAFDLLHGRWRAVNSTYGVTRLVSFGAEPSAVPADLMTELLGRCDDTGKLVTVDALEAGDKVVFATGPFTSFVAEIEKIDPDKRVWVLMDIMGSQTRVAVAPDQLRRA